MLGGKVLQSELHESVQALIRTLTPPHSVTTQVLAEDAITLLALERERVAKQQYEIENIEARRRDAEELRKQQGVSSALPRRSFS